MGFLTKVMMAIVITVLSTLGNADGPPSPDEVLAIPTDLEQLLNDHLEVQRLTRDQLLDGLVEFIFSPQGLNFQYIAYPTRDVSGTFEHREGNCLSVTLLFMALAHRMGLEAAAREVSVPMDWRREGSSLFEVGHINVLVTTPLRKAIVDFEPDPIVARRTSAVHMGKTVSVRRMLAHFYNNRAAELLNNGDLEQAVAWSDQALKLAPGFSQALNNRGVIASRGGEVPAAESFYQASLELDPNNTSTLLNLISLYRRQNDETRTQRYQKRLENLRPRDPFFLWALGQEYATNGEFSRARRMFSRARRLMPEEPKFHASLAEIHWQNGEPQRALGLLQKALKLVDTDDPLRQQYLNQLYSMGGCSAIPGVKPETEDCSALISG